MKKLYALLALALAGTAAAFAQWNTNATPKCLVSTTYVDENGETQTGGDYYACSPKVVRTPDKKTWIAWKTWGHKMINGARVTAVRTYLQLLDRDGVPQFDEPIMVNDHITPTYWSEYALCVASDGSAIVTVSDGRTEEDSYVDTGGSPQHFTPAIYKVDQEGNFLWGLDGIDCPDIADSPYTNAFVIGDDTYFIFVSQRDEVNWTGATYIQRIDADGVTAWDKPRVLRDEIFLQYYILPSLDGDLLLFDHTADGARVQRLNRDLEDQWGEPVIYDEYKYDGMAMNQYRIVSDGNGGACVAFIRPMGGFSHNIRVQHINEDGSLGFGLSGLDAYNADAYDHNYPSIAANPETQEILVQFASDQGDGKVVHQKFSFDGDYLYDELGMTIASKSVASAGGYFYGLIGVGSLKCGDWISCYRDLAAYNNESFVIRRYDKDGNRVWTRTIGREIAPSNVTFIVEEEAAYLFYREQKAGKNPGITVFRISPDGNYNVTYPTPQGDVNGDFEVGIGDIVAITNIMASDDADEAAKKAADINGDGEVGIGDIVAVTNIMAGK